MQQLKTDPIPMCRANWGRLSPGSKRLILGWLAEGNHERVETYVFQILNPSTGTPMITALPRRGGRSFGSPDDLDYSPRTHFISSAKLQKKIENIRGECYYTFLTWVRDRQGKFLFSDLQTVDPAPESSVRGCLRKMIKEGIVRKNSDHKSGQKAIYEKIPGAEATIEELLKKIPRFNTQKITLAWILNTKGEYFTLADAKEDIDGIPSTISATISTLLRDGILKSLQYKKGCKIYRLMPD
jgi:hypothetical protein